MVPFTHVLILAMILFFLGMYCVVARRNLVMVLLGLEVMLNAAGIAFVGAGLNIGEMGGQGAALFILAVAAAEVSLGLALIVLIYRQTGTVDAQCIEDGVCRLDSE